MAKEKPKPGPIPKRLKLEGRWQDRLKEAVQKRKPTTGWPKSKKKPKRRKSARS